MLTNEEAMVLKFLAEHSGESPDIQAICDGTKLSRQVVRRLLRSFEERGFVSGPPSVLQTAAAVLKQIDPKFLPTHEGYNEHILLLASALSGANEETLADELAFDQDFVRTVGSRLRASGIWEGDRLSARHREEWKDATAFYLAGAVATGELMIVGEKDGEFQWQMTDAGMKKAADLIKGMKRR